MICKQWGVLVLDYDGLVRLTTACSDKGKLFHDVKVPFYLVFIKIGFHTIEIIWEELRNCVKNVIHNLGGL
jgi:hypothetical protein